MGAHHGGGDDRHTLFIHFPRIKLDGVSDNDHTWGGAFAGVQPQISRAARDDQADIALRKVVDGDGFFHRGAQLLGGSGWSQPDRARGIEQPAKMGFTFEYLPAISTDTLEYAIAVEHAMVVNADFRVFLIVEFSVNPDLERHGGDDTGREGKCRMPKA